MIWTLTATRHLNCPGLRFIKKETIRYNQLREKLVENLKGITYKQPQTLSVLCDRVHFSKIIRFVQCYSEVCSLSPRAKQKLLFDVSVTSHTYSCCEVSQGLDHRGGEFNTMRQHQCSVPRDRKRWGGFVTTTIKRKRKIYTVTFFVISVVLLG